MKYDQQQVDRGWQQMSALLDKEMPQAIRRRPKAAWWMIAVGIALIFSGWGYHFYATNQERQHQVVPETQMLKTEIAAQPQDKAAALQESESKSTQERTVSESPSLTVNDELQRGKLPSTDQASSQSMVVNGEKDAILQDAGVHNTLTITKETTASENTREVKESIPAGKSKTYPAYQTVRTEDIVLAFEDAYPLVQANDAEPMEEAMVERTSLTTQQLASMQPGSILLSERSLPIRPADATHANAIGVEAVAATHLNSEGNPFYGLEAGLGILLRADKRLRVHAGASYSYYNISGLGLFGIGSNADEEAFGNNQGNPDPNTGAMYDLNDVYANNLEFSEARQLAEKFHYLQFPVSIEYRITPCISAAAGVKAAVLLSAPARYRLNDTRFNASPLTSASRDFLYDYDILHKFDIAPMVSIGYQISHHLSLEAAYSHGLVHYINNSTAPDRNDYHRSASIGMRYRIL